MSILHKTVLAVFLLCLPLLAAISQDTTAVIPDSAAAAISETTAVSSVPAEPVAATVQRVEKGNVVIEGIPDIPPELQARLQQYQNVRSAGFSGWDASGKGMFITTRFGETGQIHYVAFPGGARTQLTFFNEPVGGVSVRPNVNNQGFLFRKDVGGGENYQIY